MQYNQGHVTVNVPDEFSLKDQDHKRIKQSMSEAISENIKDFYINISGKIAINSSKIVAVEAEYKRYNSAQELEADGLTDVATIVKDTHYIETENGKTEHFTLQNIRITIYTVTGRELKYDSIRLNIPEGMQDRYGLDFVNPNRRYLRLNIEDINKELNNYIIELLEKRENITNHIWENIVKDVLEELYAFKYGWYMILKSNGNNEQWNHEPHTLYVVNKQETKIIKITDLLRDYFDIGHNKPSDRYRWNTAEAELRSLLYINRRGTVNTDNIKDRYPHIPIIELSYKKNYAELMKLREEQR